MFNDILYSVIGLLRKPQILSSDLGKTIRATGVYREVLEDCEKSFDDDMMQKGQFPKMSNGIY